MILDPLINKIQQIINTMKPHRASQKQQDKYHSDKTCNQLKKSTTTKLITHSQTGLYMVP